MGSCLPTHNIVYKPIAQPMDRGLLSSSLVYTQLLYTSLLLWLTDTQDKNLHENNRMHLPKMSLGKQRLNMLNAKDKL